MDIITIVHSFEILLNVCLYFVCKLMMSSIFIYSDSILNVKAILVIALEKYRLICMLIVFDIMASPVLFCSNINFEV